jgi:hypothetical protein
MNDANIVHEIALPAGAGPPIRIYVNGEEWAEGTDFHVEGGRVRFSRTLRAPPALGFRRKVMLAMGIGVYGDLRGDTLDLQYQADGRTQMAPIPLRSAAAGSPPPA